MKLSLEEKIKYVLQYNRGDIIKTPDGAKSRASFMNSLREWVKRYNEEGEAGLRRRKNKTCTDADENQVKCNTKEDTDMPEKKKTEPAETAEQKIKRLEAENEQLRAEIAVVKKSIALKVMKAKQQRNRR